MVLLVWLIVGVVVVYLCWTCNTLDKEDLGLKVIYKKLKLRFGLIQIKSIFRIRESRKILDKETKSDQSKIFEMSLCKEIKLNFSDPKF